MSNRSDKKKLRLISSDALKAEKEFARKVEQTRQTCLEKLATRDPRGVRVARALIVLVALVLGFAFVAAVLR